MRRLITRAVAPPTIACGVALLLCVAATDAATADWKVLKGLKGCELVVASFGAEALAAGYSQEAVRSRAELKLRKAGVRVLTKEENLLIEGRPYLYINVNTTADGTAKSVSFSVQVSLFEVATTARTGSAVAIIWHTSAVGRGSVEYVLGSLDRRMDVFLNDWLKANPREEPQTEPEGP